MRTLAEVKECCLIEDGHWIWKGALSDGRPNVSAPDYTTGCVDKVKSQRGCRAVWHLKNKKPIPAGHRVFRTCDEPLCVNPAHVECKCCKEWGREVAESGEWKGNPRQIIANRLKNMRRSKVTAEKLRIIQSSPHKSGNELAQELDLSKNVVSRVRNGHFRSLAVGSPFAGLGG